MKYLDYRKRITASFSRNTRNGFVDWRNCGRLYKDLVRNLDDAAQELRTEERYADLFKLCNWTYAKWGRTDKDDSNGETQDFCAFVYRLWEMIYAEGGERFSHGKMLDTFLGLLEDETGDYLDDVVYEFILTHFKSEKELARKEVFLQGEMDKLKFQIRDDDWLSYTLDVLEEYYAWVLADLRRPIEEIRHYIGKKDHYGKNRLLAQIETAYGNYEEAISLYKKQIESRPNSYWSDEPRKALMEIYKLQGDTSAYQDELYRMMLAHPETGQYFLEYKALFSEDEWEEKWEEILRLFEGKLSRINVWLSIEGRYDLIMENAEPDQEYVIEEFEKELFSLYPERCFRVLANAADREAHISSNRREYRRVAQILRKIATHPGGKEITADLAAKYRQQYPRRPAMIDELKRF